MLALSVQETKLFSNLELKHIINHCQNVQIKAINQLDLHDQVKTCSTLGDAGLFEIWDVICLLYVQLVMGSVI